MPVQAHVVALAGGHLPAGLILAGSLLMAVATVLGALLVLRRPGRHEAWLSAAAWRAAGDRGRAAAVTAMAVRVAR